MIPSDVLRMDKLRVDIDKGRLEMARIQQEIRADNRRFMAQAGIATAAPVSAGVAVGAFLVPRRPVTPAPQIIINVQGPPGTTATVVPPAHR